MPVMSKINGVEVVAKTQITTSMPIYFNENLQSVDRYIYVVAKDQNTKLYEFSKDDDLMQSATVLTGSPNKCLDWDDTTADSITADPGTAETEWFKWDLGSIKDILLYIKASKSSATFKIYVSNDDVNYTLLINLPASYQKALETTCRYIKVTYEVSSNYVNSQTFNLYTIMAFDKNSGYSATPNADGIIEYYTNIKNKQSMVILMTSDAYYRIIDFDKFNETKTKIEVV